MHATIFVTIGYGIIAGESFHMTEEADSTTECLRKLQDRLSQKLPYMPVLTFRPHDGMIFCGNISPIIPIGVLYQQGYAPEDAPRPHRYVCPT